MTNNFLKECYQSINICSTQTALMISDNKNIIKKYIASDRDFIEDEICEFIEAIDFLQNENEQAG